MLLPLRRAAVIATAGGLLAATLPAGAGASSTTVDYGPISHQGMVSKGAASKSSKMTLQIGLIANQSGIQAAVKAASNPASSSYGKYPSLGTLASTYGASSNRRNAVAGAFKPYGVTATADVTHLQMTATISIGNAQKLFGTSWTLYQSGGETLALPTHTPKVGGTGLAGNVDTIAGMRLVVSGSGAAPTSTTSAARPPAGHAAQAPVVAGGTPTRTGTPSTGCLASQYPLQALGSAGLMPNQILSAYGIAPLQAAGLRGQGVRLAIVGEAPTPASDVNAYRTCFGATGTALAIHNAGSIQPILESSLDAMVSSTVVPQLTNFDLWVSPLNENADDGDVLGFLKMLAQPMQAAAGGKHPLPDVVSVSYGECEPTVAPFTASRTLVERELSAMAAVGITVVVAAGDTGSSACARGVPPGQLTSAQKQPQAEWPATSPWVLAVGGTSLTLNAANGIASTGSWNDTGYAAPYTATSGGGGGQSTLNARPWWQPAPPFASTGKRMVPDVAAFADPAPGYPIFCSSGVKSCGPGAQSISFVGGTSAATPLVAGMVALWKQQAKAKGLPKPGFVTPLLYTLAHRSPASLVDVGLGTNALFGGPCCSAGAGYDLATGLGSPLADQIAALLVS